jgi:hypothetical protein
MSPQTPTAQTTPEPITPTAYDFIRPGEEAEYEETRTALHENLNPQGELESLFFDEIVTAAWRLRRCSIIESAIAQRAAAESDLTESGLTEADQTRQESVDRTRTRYHNLLRRSISELRKLQTERSLRQDIGGPNTHWGLTDLYRFFRGVQACEAYRQLKIAEKSSEIDAALEQILAEPPAESPAISFCNSAEAPAPAPRKPESARPLSARFAKILRGVHPGALRTSADPS